MSDFSPFGSSSHRPCRDRVWRAAHSCAIALSCAVGALFGVSLAAPTRALAADVPSLKGGEAPGEGDRTGAIPPSWQVDNHELYPKQKGQRGQKGRRSAREWYQPAFALGIGASLPEVLPIEGYAFFGRYFALRLFYTPPIPFNIRVEMPSDVISTKKGIGVANPDFTIRLRAIYGAHYGAEALVFPFAGSFFLSSGVSHRRMRLSGSAKSPILVCSLVEAAAEPPCADPEARIETATEIELKAKAETTALLMRASLGWFWHIGSAGYLSFSAGATKPTRIRSNVEVEANLDTPAEVDPDIEGALAEVKAEREADLRDKAFKEMRPVEEKMLPIIALSAGIRL
jgi:hypothetical protein